MALSHQARHVLVSLSQPNFLGGKAVSPDGIVKRDKMEPHRGQREGKDCGRLFLGCKAALYADSTPRLETREARRSCLLPQHNWDRSDKHA